MSEFPGEHTEREARCFLGGDVVASTPEGDGGIGPGDMAEFAQGLQCTGNVTKPVKKHFAFG